jgi:hypothetical protein
MRSRRRGSQPDGMTLVWYEVFNGQGRISNYFRRPLSTTEA